MPLTPEEPQIYESVPGPRSAAGAARTPQAARTAAPLPGPRPSARPTPPRADAKGPSTPGRPGGTEGQGKGAGNRTAPNAPAAAAPTAQIELVGATEATAVEVADETVDKLLDEGRAPSEILLITTGEQHPWAQHELSFGEDAYWGQLAEGEDVFCAHSSVVARTTPRAIVLLAVNGGTDPEAAAALPASLEKATEQLIVCGDPQRLRGLL